MPLSPPTAFEHLTSFIYYAYRFYSGLHEEHNLSPFRGKWLEALGDLASYRMAVANHLANQAPPEAATSSGKLSTSDIEILSEPTVARIDDSPVPSIGAHAAAELGEEDERDTWRTKAREWYAMGLQDTPGAGRLQHHLGTLSRDVPGEQIRAVYHFVKSLIAVHSFDSGRESMLRFFSPSVQQSLSAPTAPAPSLFLHMQGLLFTRINLDEVLPTLGRFIERLELDNAAVDEADWTMMAVLSIGSLLEFGKADGQVRKAGAFGASGAPKPNGADEEDKATVDGPSPRREEEDDHELSHLSRPMQALSTDPIESTNTQDQLVFSLAMNVAFTTLAHLLRSNPYMTVPTAYGKPPLNPYITTLLTFLSTVFKVPTVVALMERSFPWATVAEFAGQFVSRTTPASRDTAKFAIGQLLPEDWCLRGMEWAGRRVYERGFWKANSPACRITGEMEVIAPSFAAVAEFADEMVEDGGEDGMEWESSSPSHFQALGAMRFKRLRSATEMLLQSVPGLEWNPDLRTVQIGGELLDKVSAWEAQRLQEEEEEFARRHRRRPSDEMDVDEDGDEGEDLEEDGDDSDPNESEEIRELKARRRYLQSLVQSSERTHQSPSFSRKRCHQSTPARTRPALKLAPGYTILVVDTNILLSSLSVVRGLVESKLWTIVVPLAVITELDGISKNDSPLGGAATDALNYLIYAVPGHSTTLKVQTSKGNYLRTLSVRSEHIDFRDGSSRDRTMDDLILRSALWQAEHFVDWSLTASGVGSDAVAPSSTPSAGTSKVVLMSFDRNLRLKARSRQLDAADEQDMAAILAIGS